MLGLAKAASWLHSGLPVGTSSRNAVSTFKTMRCIAVLCTSPPTCRANLAQRVDRWSRTFVSCWLASLRYVSIAQPQCVGFRGAWLLPIPQRPGIGMWPRLANQSTPPGQNDCFMWLTLGQWEPSLGLFEDSEKELLSCPCGYNLAWGKPGSSMLGEPAWWEDPTLLTTAEIRAADPLWGHSALPETLGIFS